MKPPPRLAQLETRYAALRQELAGVGYLSQGSVYRRPAGQSGNRFTWSTKVKTKTVSLALSEEQADWLEQAIAEHRCVKTILAEMHRLSRQIMRVRFPDTNRRRPLNRKFYVLSKRHSGMTPFDCFFGATVRSRSTRKFCITIRSQALRMAAFRSRMSGTKCGRGDARLNQCSGGRRNWIAFSFHGCQDFKR